MVLRLLQYEDDTDFTWNKSAELAEKLGLPVVPANSGEYTRGNAVDVIWALLETKFKSGGKTLAQTLIEKGVFTEKAYREALGEDSSNTVSYTHLDVYKRQSHHHLHYTSTVSNYQSF